MESSAEADFALKAAFFYQAFDEIAILLTPNLFGFERKVDGDKLLVAFKYFGLEFIFFIIAPPFNKSFLVLIPKAG